MVRIRSEHNSEKYRKHSDRNQNLYTGKKKASSRKKRELSPFHRLSVTTEQQKKLMLTAENNSYCVFDIETTGGNPSNNGITEICAFRLKDGAITDKFYSLVNPKIPIPPIVRKMTGINNKMLKDAPLIREVMPSFLNFLGDDILVSHNTIGDLKFIRYFAEQTTGQVPANFFLCTHLLTERIFPGAPDKSLSGIAAYLGATISEGSHRAEADAKLTIDVFLGLLRQFHQHDLRSVEDAIRFQDDFESALRLGWAIHQDELDSIRNSSGVLRFFGKKKQELFLISSFNCRRSLTSFRQTEKIPRQILRDLMRATRIRADYFPHIYPAMLHEQTLISEASIRSHPSSLHQRSTLAFCIFAGDNVTGADYLLKITNPTTPVMHVFGPISDRKAAVRLSEQLRIILGSKKSSQGITIPANRIRQILDLFEQKKPSAFRKLFKKSLNLVFFLSKALRTKQQELSKAELLLEELRQDLQGYDDLTAYTGMILIEDSANKKSFIYPVIQSQSYPPFEGSLPAKEWLLRTEEGLQKISEFRRKAKQAQKKKGPYHLCSASLWMLCGKKGKLPPGSSYLPLEEMDKI